MDAFDRLQSDAKTAVDRTDNLETEVHALRQLVDQLRSELAHLASQQLLEPRVAALEATLNRLDHMFIQPQSGVRPLGKGIGQS